MTPPPRHHRARWPRGMRPATAAEYCDMSPNTFRQICPVQPAKPRRGVVLYDRAAIDAWLDRLHDAADSASHTPPAEPSDGWDDIVHPQH